MMNFIFPFLQLKNQKVSLFITICLHFCAFLLNFLIFKFRDAFIQEICWSTKKSCSCTFQSALFFMFSGVFLQIVSPLFLIFTLMFCYRMQLLKQKSTKIMIIAQYIIAILVPYLYGYFHMDQSPKTLSYMLALFWATIYSFVYVRKLLKYDIRTYLRKMKVPFVFVHGAFVYFVLMSIMMPTIYYYLSKLAKNNTKNYFQLLMIMLTNLYESLYSYLFVKMSKLVAEHQISNKEGEKIDFTFMIVIAKYYYVVVYSLRIGNILYLDFLDWGFYLQFFSFSLFLLQHSTGISLFSLFILKPLAKKLIKSQKTLMEYISYHRKILDSWMQRTPSVKNKSMLSSTRKILTCSNQKEIVGIKSARNIQKAFPNANNFKKKSIIVSQRNAFYILCYQKLEFFLIYVPTLLFLWLYRTWRSPEPNPLFTKDCTFEMNNIVFQGYSIIAFISLDFVVMVVFVGILFKKGKLKQFYEVENLNLFGRMLLYMGFQITFENWVCDFSSYQWFVQ